MKTSDQINELAAALSKAQGELEDAVKDGINPHFRSNYATLSAVLEVVRKPLSKNNLCVIQTVDCSDQGHHLTTRLLHASGQWIESICCLIVAKEDMQGIASATTYARRNALSAMVGISQKDDDAEETMGQPTVAPGVPVAPKTMGSISVASNEAPTFSGPTDAQLKRLYAIANGNGWTATDSKIFIGMKFNVGSAKELTSAQYQQACDYIQKNKPVLT